MGKADNLLLIAERMPAGLTRGQQLELTYALHCWDEIAVKEHMPHLVINLVPQKSIPVDKNVFGLCTGAGNIYIAIVVETDDGEPIISVASMRETFLHELAHAIRSRDDEDSGSHDRNWQLEFNRLQCKYSSTLKAKEAFAAKQNASRYGSLKDNQTFYKEPKPKK